MRPIAETWVASVNTNPAPPAALEPSVWTCQSSPRPSLALYWHIGETTMRLRAVTDRKLIGWKSSGVDMRLSIPMVERTRDIRVSGADALAVDIRDCGECVSGVPGREHSVHPVLGGLRPCRQCQRGIPASAPGRRYVGD